MGRFVMDLDHYYTIRRVWHVITLHFRPHVRIIQQKKKEFIMMDLGSFNIDKAQIR